MAEFFRYQVETRGLFINIPFGPTAAPCRAKARLRRILSFPNGSKFKVTPKKEALPIWMMLKKIHQIPSIPINFGKLIKIGSQHVIFVPLVSSGTRHFSISPELGEAAAPVRWFSNPQIRELVDV